MPAAPQSTSVSTKGEQPLDLANGGATAWHVAMIAEQIPAVQQLTLQEKWLLANELWDEVEEYQQELPTRPEIMGLVELRLAEYERDPSTAMNLEEFKRCLHLP